MGNHDSRPQHATELDPADEHEGVQQLPYVTNPFSCFCKANFGQLGPDQNLSHLENTDKFHHPKQIYQMAKGSLARSDSSRVSTVMAGKYQCLNLTFVLQKRKT